MKRVLVRSGVAITLGVVIFLLWADGVDPIAAGISSLLTGRRTPAASTRAPDGKLSPSASTDPPRVRITRPRTSVTAPVTAGREPDPGDASSAPEEAEGPGGRKEDPAERASELQRDISVCLDVWSDAEPHRNGRLLLRLDLDPEGLVDAWAEGQGEVPDGVADCLGDAVWKHDWSGAVEMPLDLTIPYRFTKEGP